MDIIDLPKVKELGEEYGWPERQLEMALSTAIRLIYMERDQLVESDVNLAEGWITVRRRNGEADKGTWQDIDRPLLPNTTQLMAVMEMMQWGDGAPGRLLEGEVSGYRDAGIIYRVQENLLFVPENLVAPADMFDKPAIGSVQVLALCASLEPNSKMRMASRRGREFILAVTEAYFPGSVNGVWMGASNSWAVLRMPLEAMTSWLENGGVNVQHLQKVCGLRRITLIPQGRGDSEQEQKDNELKHFINNSWKSVQIQEITPFKLALQTPENEQEPKKIRTFHSMLKKIAPERDIILY